MCRVSITVLSIAIFLNLISGCTSTNIVGVEKNINIDSTQSTITTIAAKKIVRVQRIDSVLVVYNEGGAGFKESYQGKDSVIVGIKDGGGLSVTKLELIQIIWYEDGEVSVGKTAAPRWRHSDGCRDSRRYPNSTDIYFFFWVEGLA